MFEKQKVEKSSSLLSILFITNYKLLLLGISIDYNIIIILFMINYLRYYLF